MNRGIKNDLSLMNLQDILMMISNHSNKAYQDGNMLRVPVPSGVAMLDASTFDCAAYDTHDRLLISSTGGSDVEPHVVDAMLRGLIRDLQKLCMKLMDDERTAVMERYARMRAKKPTP